MPSHENRIPARLESKHDVADGLSVFRFSLAEDFHFKPGQYATLWLTHKGQTLPRPYSISSSPSDTRFLEFYINLVEEGRLTPSLWDKEVLTALEKGHGSTEVAVTGPRGRFVLDPNDPRDLLFVSSGTGVGPFISMIRTLSEQYARDPNGFRRRRIYLVHGVSFSSHLGYREELRRLAAESTADPSRKLSLIYLPTISRPHLETNWTGLKGRAETLLEPCISAGSTLSNLQDTVKSMLGTILQPETHAVYVCGHPGTIDGVMRALTARGFKPDADVKTEKYYP